MLFDFYLEKWYSDCVDEAGNYSIGYHANVSIVSQSITYSALLASKNNRKEELTSYGNKEAPSINDNGIMEWIMPKWGMESRSKPKQQGFSRVLYENNNGKVEWQCLIPLADSSCILENIQVMGYGYSERLIMTILPWKLPIKELRWGRWLAEGISIVWIEWKGEFPITLIYENGIECSAKKISETEISTEQFTLHLKKHDTIREGYIVKTALRNMPGIKTMLPKAIRKLNEKKWVSKGILIKNNTEIHGWAIHEKVTW